MKSSSFKAIISGNIWGIFGKLLAAVVNFVSLPILLNVYGKSDYGLVGVVMSTNAFLQIVNLGVPMGAVKFFSEWIEGKDEDSLKQGVQSNLLFFTLIAFVNSAILAYLGYNAGHYFKVSHPAMLSTLFYLSAILTFPNWYFLSLQHVLMGYERIGQVNLMNSIASILNLVATLVAYVLKAPLEVYFIIYLGTNMVVIPLSIYECRRIGAWRREYLFPAWHKRYFRVIIKYSFSLFALGLLQVLAVNVQPLLLGTMEANGDVAVANYRILQNVTMLVSLFSSTFLASFLPYVSKANYRGDTEGIRNFVLATTKWLSVIVFFFCFLIAFNPGQVLSIYVGKQGSGLEIWLIIWILGVCFNNNQGISSTMLSIGRLRGVIIGVAIASASTIVFSFLFVKKYGVGIAATSYLLYRVMEAFVIYGYYIPRIMKMRPGLIFGKSIVPPLVVALTALGLTKALFYWCVPLEQPFLYMFAFGCVSLALYALLVYRFCMTAAEREMLGNAARMLQKVKIVSK